MTVATSSIALIFEASIAAQMLLFAGVQAAGVPRYGALRGVLSVLTGSLGVAVAVNALAALGIWTALRDANLFLEITCAAAVYLYVAHARDGAPALTARDALHLAPPTLAVAIWKLNLLSDVDVVVLSIVGAYAAAAVATAFAHRARYRPKPLWWFVLLLTVSLALLVLLRALIAIEIQFGVVLRDTGAYAALLIVMLALSSGALLIELRYPNLLSAPSSYVKYGAEALTQGALASLDERFQGIMRTQRPYLEPELTLADLASRLDVPERHLSQLANARYRMTVPALLNAWRAEEAAHQLADPGNRKPITSIMYHAGFGSKSAFQREFQKKYGMSPTAYRARRPR